MVSFPSTSPLLPSLPTPRDYFWGTAAAWGLARLIQTARTLYHSRLGLPATIETLPDNFLLIRIHSPRPLAIAPGQHVFLRFLDAGLHAFTAHPFTVCGTGDGGRTADVVLRVRGGTTRVLAGRAEGKPAVATRVMVDGPYGGVPVALGTYERVLLLAGGSGELVSFSTASLSDVATGATFTVPILVDLAQKMQRGEARCKRIDFVLAVQHEGKSVFPKERQLEADASLADSYVWMEEQIAAVRDLLPPDVLNISIHVTREDVPEKEKSATPESSVESLFSRPNLPNIISEAARVTNGTLAVAGKP